MFINRYHCTDFSPTTCVRDVTTMMKIARGTNENWKQETKVDFCCTTRKKKVLALWVWSYVRYFHWITIDNNNNQLFITWIRTRENPLSTALGFNNKPPRCQDTLGHESFGSMLCVVAVVTMMVAKNSRRLYCERYRDAASAVTH